MSLAILNPFVAQETARAYAQGRPYFHPLVMAKVKETLALQRPVKLAVDVACGTGMSSLALLALADWVVATDISPEMLAQAPENERIRYHLAPAEALPLGNEQADLVTVSLAFHWFDRMAFLREAKRVLHPHGWLVLYGNSFKWSQVLDAELRSWFGRYYAEHPEPSKNRVPFTDEDARNAGFEFAERLEYENTWTFTLSAFVAYLLSQSNAVAAIEAGRYTTETLASALTAQLEPFFPSGEETFPFTGFIWHLRRS